MIPFKHILVAVDFGESSREALELAIELSQRLDATLTLAHACEVPAYAYAGMTFIAADLLGPIQEAARAALAEQLADVQKRVPQAKSILRTGSAAMEILAVIDETKPDLVVIGTHGRHGVARALLGSVAERIVRLSRVPVLTARQRQD